MYKAVPFIQCPKYLDQKHILVCKERFLACTGCFSVYQHKTQSLFQTKVLKSKNTNHNNKKNSPVNKHRKDKQKLCAHKHTQKLCLYKITQNLFGDGEQVYDPVLLL